MLSLVPKLSLVVTRGGKAVKRAGFVINILIYRPFMGYMKKFEIYQSKTQNPSIPLPL